MCEPKPMSAWPESWMCVHSLAGFAGSIQAGGMDVRLLCVVCCLVEVSATGRSLAQRSPTECGVSECDREAVAVTRRTSWRSLGTSQKAAHRVEQHLQLQAVSLIDTRTVL
jgi:hypothetical protein